MTKERSRNDKRRRRGDPSRGTSAMSLPTAADGGIVNERSRGALTRAVA